MDAILKTLSLVMNENRRNKVVTTIKQLKMCEYSAHTDFSSNCYVLVIWEIMVFLCYACNIVPIFVHKNICGDPALELSHDLNEMVLVRGHNICFHSEISKLSLNYPS